MTADRKRNAAGSKANDTEESVLGTGSPPAPASEPKPTEPGEPRPEKYEYDTTVRKQSDDPPPSR